MLQRQSPRPRPRRLLAAAAAACRRQGKHALLRKSQTHLGMQVRGRHGRGLLIVGGHVLQQLPPRAAMPSVVGCDVFNTRMRAFTRRPCRFALIDP